MSVLFAGLDTKLMHVQEQLRRTFADAPGIDDVCLTCSFQAEDVLLLKLALELRPELPTLFLDTGYHFAETYAYRDRIAREWDVRLINLLPLTTVAEQEAQIASALPGRLSHCFARWLTTKYGSQDCGGNRRRPAPGWRSRRSSRYPAATRS